MSKWWIAIGFWLGLTTLLWSSTATAEERCPATKAGTIDASTPAQSGRLKNGPASACGTPKPVEKVLQPKTPFRFAAHAFKNRATSPQCITVTLTTTAGTAQSATYLGAFDPSSPQANYLGDGGGNANVGTLTYGVTVPALATFVVTVNAVGAADATYTLDVAGCGAVVVSAVTPNAGPAAGGTAVTIAGSGFLANPTVTVGGAPATNILLVDEATITATTPPGAEGLSDVTVTNTDATTSTLAGGFAYVAAAGTTLSVMSSANPSAFGQAVTLTAKAESSAGTPVGNVTFLDGAQSLGVVALDAAGTATFTSSTFTVGAHPITVVYAGDAMFAAGVSPVVSQTVDKAATKTTLASSENPSPTSSGVTFTATVTSVAPGAGVPTGTVEFSDGGASLGSVAVDATGKATFTTTSLAAASHDIVATYSGSDTHLTSASATLVQAVGVVTTVTTLTSSPNPSQLGEPVTFTVTVQSAVPGAIPTGKVDLLDDGVTIGTATLDADGRGFLTSSSLALGSHPLVAAYTGDALHAPSSSPVLSQAVDEPTPTRPPSPDYGSDAGTNGDAGAAPVVTFEGGGCDCREASRGGGSGLSVAAGVFGVVAILSRRRRARRP